MNIEALAFQNWMIMGFNTQIHDIIKLELALVVSLLQSKKLWKLSNPTY